VLDLQLSVALPMDLEHQKLLTQPVFSVEPQTNATDRWGQRCAVFDLGTRSRRLDPPGFAQRSR